ncbi:GIY-YIG nuclease family protein [uncultured Vagococcus sp.]|uniref:GIY-YIG nuclease family protein n=1 Tax=uncultured Vagococcus sp. TaxID=189676 RepID=UPI0028D24970|nr:GIY-YIG nuclease family protein [uncultured Vagococcus sp.]
MSLKEQALGLPTTPGCYIMRNKRQEIIYIGKAVNLKRRVSSYFNKLDHEKTQRLMHEMTFLEVIHLGSDEEALALEALLIAQFKPYYNRALKEERQYTYIEITAERNPQLLLTETITETGEFFGPYSSKQLAQLLYNFLEREYPLSKCQHNKGRPCLYVDLGMCLGGCYREVDPALYSFQQTNIREFLQLPLEEMIRLLVEERERQSRQQSFERAQEVQLLISLLEKQHNRQPAPIVLEPNCDYLGIKQVSQFCLFQVSHIRNGIVSATNWWTVPGVLSVNQQLASVQSYFNHPNHQRPSTLYIPETLTKIFEDSALTVSVGSDELEDYFWTKTLKNLVLAEKVYLAFEAFVIKERSFN